MSDVRSLFQALLMYVATVVHCREQNLSLNLFPNDYKDQDRNIGLFTDKLH